MFLDFQKIKQLASLEMVAGWLGLEIKGNRCQCPVNEGDDRELVLTFDKGLWTCFGCKKKYGGKQGGDQIALVSHVLQVDQKEAAKHIQTKFHGYTPDKRGLPSEGLDYLQYEMSDTQALGITPQKAEELGIGWALVTSCSNASCSRFRDKTGKLLGYIGFNTELDPCVKLPNSLR